MKLDLSKRVFFLIITYRDQRVRNEARMVFSVFLDPNIANDIVYGRVKLPSFVEFVNHVRPY